MFSFKSSFQKIFQKISRFIKNVTLDESDFERISNDVAQQILENNRKRFLNEEGPNGPFPPSKRGQIRKSGGYTRSSRDGRYYTGTGTYYETGTLYKSIDVKVGGGGKITVFYTDPIGDYLKGPLVGFGDEDIALINKQITKRFKNGKIRR